MKCFPSPDVVEDALLGPDLEGGDLLDEDGLLKLDEVVDDDVWRPEVLHQLRAHVYLCNMQLHPMAYSSCDMSLVQGLALHP